MRHRIKCSWTNEYYVNYSYQGNWKEDKKHGLGTIIFKQDGIAYK